MIILNDVMKEIVDKHVKAYKTDLNYDIEGLLDKNRGNEYYWSVRDTGTDLIDKVPYLVKDTYAYCSALIHLQDSKHYLIKVEKKGKKYIYGEVIPIKRKDFEKLINDAKDPKDIKRVDVMVLTQDNRKLNMSYNKYNEDIFYDLLRDLKISREEYKARYETYTF